MALLTRTSRRPQAEVAAAAAASTERRSRRSMATACTPAPVALISAAVVSRLPGNTTDPEALSPRPSPSWTVRALITTSHPARAKARAAQRPMPRLAPVTKATGRPWWWGDTTAHDTTAIRRRGDDAERPTVDGAKEPQ